MLETGLVGCGSSRQPENISPCQHHPIIQNKKENHYLKIANLISKLNFYKLIPYPMDICFTGRRDRSCQTPEKDVLYIILAGSVSSVHSLGVASHLLPVQTE